MLYCGNCMVLCNNNTCGFCGSKELAPPKENDPVFLMSRDALWCGGVEETLKENDIPCIKQGAQGAAITANLGYTTETYSFYVPYAAYEKAKEIFDLE